MDKSGLMRELLLGFSFILFTVMHAFGLSWDKFPGNVRFFKNVGGSRNDFSISIDKDEIDGVGNLNDISIALICRIL